MAYRLTDTGAEWGDVAGRSVVADVRERYPEFFAVILDPADTRDPDLRPLRRDLEHAPVDRRNFDALNAVAVGYFELNYRAESDRGGDRYFGVSLRATHLVAIPWRAYGEIEDPRLRDAILDFFEDAGLGDKPGAASTSGRLARVVGSLERKEADPVRAERIRAIVAAIQARQADGAP